MCTVCVYHHTISICICDDMGKSIAGVSNIPKVSPYISYYLNINWCNNVIVYIILEFCNLFLSKLMTRLNKWFIFGIEQFSAFGAKFLFEFNAIEI